MKRSAERDLEIVKTLTAYQRDLINAQISGFEARLEKLKTGLEVLREVF